MDKITVVIVDNHQIVCQGIKSLLASVSDISIRDTIKNIKDLSAYLRASQTNVALINLYCPSDSDLKYIQEITSHFPKVRLLILAMDADEKFFLKTLRAGAKGMLTKESTRNELVEAIYTVRSGYDYFDKSITNIILNSYLHKTPLNGDNSKKESLSQREEEVLTLYGEGFTNKEMADKLFISIRTVESHKNNIMKKINLRTTVDMVKFAIRNNYVDL